MKVMKALFPVSLSLIGFTAFSDPVSGWKQTAAGAYNFSDTENWVNGEVNGVFGEDLVFEGDQSIRLPENGSIPGLQVACDGGGFALSFSSSGKSGTTVTTTGDIFLGGHNFSSVKFGNSNSAWNFNLDLGGTVRTIKIGTATDFRVSLLNGGVIWENSVNLTLMTKNTYAGGTWLKGSGAIMVARGDVFGDATSPLHLCENARVISSSKSQQTLLDYPVFLDGNCQIGSDSGNNVGVYFGNGPVSISKPLTLTCQRHWFSFGPLADVSPYTWRDVTFTRGSTTYTGNLILHDFTLPADETWVLKGANFQLDAEHLLGTIDLSDCKLTLHESAAISNAIVRLGENGTLAMTTTTGGDLKLVDKVIWTSGAGVLSIAGKAGADTTYETALELQHGKGTPTLQATAAADVVTKLHVTSLVRPEGAMMSVGGAVNGETVQLAIDGQEATDLIPWMRATDGAFVGYDVKKGVVPFDLEATDVVTYEDGMTTADVAGKHLRIPNGLAFTPDADVTVKSLAVLSSGTATSVGESDYRITVSSGAVNLYAAGNVEINSAISFAKHHGYLTFRNGYIHKINKSIDEATGMTFSDLRTTPVYNKDYKGLGLYCATTYAGNTYIHGPVYPYTEGALPYGERSGNVYNYDYLNFWKSGTSVHFNGLEGNGIIEKDSSAMIVYLGTDNSDGVFSGSTYNYPTTKAFGIHKLGTGRQVLSGSLAFQNYVAVECGVLEVNGSLTVTPAKGSYHAISVKKGDAAAVGGTLAGAGSLTAKNGVIIKNGGVLFPGSAQKPGTALRTSSETALKFEEGSALKIHLGADYCSQVTCGAGVSGAVEVPVTVENALLKQERKLLLEANTFEPTFVLANRQPGERLTAETVTDAELGTSRQQLWYSRSIGLAIIFR